MADQAQGGGRYVPLEQLWRDARVVAHRARSTDHAGRVVQVWRLRGEVDERAGARLRERARALAAFEQGGVAPVIEVLTGPDGVAVVLPWAAGRSVAALWADGAEGGAVLSSREVARVGARVAATLARLHAAGEAHGDVGATTVLLGVDDEVRLAGVDLAIAGRDAPSRPTPADDLHQLGRLLGVLGVARKAERTSDQGTPDEVAGALAAVVGELCTETRDHRRPAVTAEQVHARLAGLVPPESALTPRRWTAPAAPSPRVPGRSSGRPRASERRRRWSVVLAVGVLAVAVGVLVATGREGLPSGAADAARPRPGTSSSSARVSPSPSAGTSSPSARVSPPPCTTADVTRAATVVLADVDGRGCALALTVGLEEVDGRARVVLTLPPAAGDLAGRYEVGAPGDRVLVGDWDCDGTDTPAVHRPDDGRVYLFDGYGSLEPRLGPTLAPGEDAVVRTHRDGCDRVGPAR